MLHRPLLPRPLPARALRQDRRRSGLGLRCGTTIPLRQATVGPVRPHRSVDLEEGEGTRGVADDRSSSRHRRTYGITSTGPLSPPRFSPNSASTAGAPRSNGLSAKAFEAVGPEAVPRSSQCCFGTKRPWAQNGQLDTSVSKRGSPGAARRVRLAGFVSHGVTQPAREDTPNSPMVFASSGESGAAPEPTTSWKVFNRLNARSAANTTAPRPDSTSRSPTMDMGVIHVFDQKVADIHG